MRALSDGRVRRSEAEWRGIIKSFQKSGLSQAEFCKQHGLRRPTLTHWLRRLGEQTPARGEFVELDREGTEEPRPRRCELELSLPGGVILRWMS